MIKEIFSEEFHLLKKIIEEEDIARNYFILLGLSSDKEVFNKIYGEYEGNVLKAVLFVRKSGLLQFYAPGDFNLDGFAELIFTLNSDKLIGPKLYCDKLFRTKVFTSATEGAYISRLDKNHELKHIHRRYKIRNININDLEEIVELYKKVFPSFSPKDVMEKKLITNRGRGICIEDNNRIVSVAQTDFETKNSSLIVGIATDSDYRCKGMATECTYVLSNILQEEGKNVFLQYDNPEAGEIYERLGYRRIDRVVHYKK
ncbi:MAG: GNAT family N-acetyltransferase [Firmicutes bacterium]|nr:GNAT family N-acetyltransferase [Bacillota bacterium]